MRYKLLPVSNFRYLQIPPFILSIQKKLETLSFSKYIIYGLNTKYVKLKVPGCYSHVLLSFPNLLFRILLTSCKWQKQSREGFYIKKKVLWKIFSNIAGLKRNFAKFLWNLLYNTPCGERFGNETTSLWEAGLGFCKNSGKTLFMKLYSQKFTPFSSKL